ncbi:hypothetical protein PENTCL1PPCAC_29311, partial [Pristionchus entomophagus]
SSQHMNCPENAVFVAESALCICQKGYRPDQSKYACVAEPFSLDSEHIVIIALAVLLTLAIAVILGLTYQLCLNRHARRTKYPSSSEEYTIRLDED